ncbi:MAG: hypothetical protein KAU84_03085 [Thermoplasmatales archaeon]|nr:hypothetical protein [Thermoplasmatales archaeon]
MKAVIITTVKGVKMSGYKIKINRLLKDGERGNIKTEIWAEITNRETSTTMNKLIWWQDENGIYHDGTPNLPVHLREMVDNAWIEKSRKW